MYCVPREVPQAVDLFGEAEMVESNGCLYVAWPGMPVDAAVPLRAKVLFDALQWLHDHNEHYNDARVASCLDKWRERLRTAHPADVDAGGIEIDDFTSEGPMPAGADIVQLQKLRGLARLEPRIDELLFPALFPTGSGRHACMLRSHARTKSHIAAMRTYMRASLWCSSVKLDTLADFRVQV